MHVARQCFQHFCTKRGEYDTEIHEELVKDLDHISSCWCQLIISIMLNLLVMLSLLLRMLKFMNGGFGKLGEIREEASHQSSTRENHILARMKDEYQSDEFE